MTAAALRRAAALSLAVLLTLPMGPVAVAATSGTIRGSVLLEGRPLSGVTVAFIELESGEVVRAVSGEDGAFETPALPGQYAVTTESQAGLTVGSAPVQVAVAAGQVASAEVALLAVPSALPLVASAEGTPQQPPPPDTPPADLPSGSPQQPGMPVYAETTGSGASIRFEPVTCFVAGEYPLLDANIDPVQSVARARVYFRAAVSDQYYYVEMTQDAGIFYGKLPRPQVEASPITYYIQSTTAEFEESQTREIEAIVVEDESECEGRPIAAFGPPGAVTVFSATTGAAVSPVGFAALSAGIAIGTIALIVGGAAAAGVVGGVVTPGGPGTEVPPVVVVPSPIPTPTPLPTPEPTPIPTPPITAFR